MTPASTTHAMPSSTRHTSTMSDANPTFADVVVDEVKATKDESTLEVTNLDDIRAESKVVLQQALQTLATPMCAHPPITRPKKYTTTQYERRTADTAIGVKGSSTHAAPENDAVRAANQQPPQRARYIARPCPAA